MHRPVDRLARLAACCLAVALLTTPALAEKADRSKPIQIEANSVHMDDLNKVATYVGGVILIQGTLRVEAEKLMVRQDAEGHLYGDATGAPARFRQKMEGSADYVEGQGERIEFDARKDQVQLRGNARLKRGEEDLRGNLIVYNTRTEVYQAQGASEPGGSGRVKAIILPRRQGQSAAPASDTAPAAGATTGTAAGTGTPTP